MPSRRSGVTLIASPVALRVALLAGIALTRASESPSSNADETLAFGATVVHLNETNFEHLTQAASGATSGDWLVKFCQESVPRCVRFGQTWEKIATSLAASREAKDLPRINVATVDSEHSSRLVERFQLNSFPAVLFFKQGVMYNYNGGSFSVEKISKFAERDYQRSPRRRVPPEAHIATPHDETFLISIGSVAVLAAFLYLIDLYLQRVYRLARLEKRRQRSLGKEKSS